MAGRGAVEAALVGIVYEGPRFGNRTLYIWRTI